MNPQELYLYDPIIAVRLVDCLQPAARSLPLVIIADARPAKQIAYAGHSGNAGNSSGQPPVNP
jgi:hypothetical protein